MQTTLLFDSVHSAQEVAFMLRASWDKCNAVTFNDFDEDDEAFQTVIKIASAKYCIIGQKCLIKDVESHNNLPTSSISFRQIPSKIGCDVTLVSQDHNLIDKELLEAVTKRMFLEYSIHQKLLKQAPGSENDMPLEI